MESPVLGLGCSRVEEAGLGGRVELRSGLVGMRICG